MSTAPGPLTPRQASIFAAVSHYHEALGEPVPAAYVARKLGLARQTVMEYFQALNDLGWLRASGSPAVPTRPLPEHGIPLTKTQVHSPAVVADAPDVLRKAAPQDAAGAPRFVDLGPLDFRAVVTPETINEEDRTVELVFTTGAPVMRYDWMSDTRYLETLSLDPAQVRLDRLNSGAPLLDTHSSYSLGDQIGTVVAGSVRLLKGEGRARVRFSRRDSVEPVWQDVRDGIISNVSVGYRVYKFEETVGEGNALPVRKAIDWEPFEISLVPMPADAGAKVRSGRAAVPVNACEIVSRAAEPVAPEGDPVKDLNRAPEFVAEVPVIPPAPAPAPAAPPTATDQERAAVARERARNQGILLACRAARLPQEYADRLIADESVNLEAAQTRVLEELSRRGGAEVGPSDVPSGASSVVIVGDDPIVHARAGIVNALLHRVAPERFKLEDSGRPYRGMSVLAIGTALLNARGVRTSRMDRSQLVDAMLQRTGMHTTSDFPALFEDAANKNLRSAYEAAPQTWRPLAKTVMLSDFKPSRQLQVGDAPELEEILEHGEYKHGTIAEAKEQVQLKTYGKMFAITRQALINDDLNAFGEIPAAFGRKAADKESDLAWAQITSNPLMGDGVNLFDASGHLNYTTPGTAISIDSLGVARAALRLQKGIDGVTLLNLAARYLIVPAAKETKADQMVSTQLVANASGSINPFAGRLQVIAEPRLDGDSAVAWYMATDVSQAPVLYYGTLDGQGGPLVTQQEGFDVDGMKFRCRIDVALKAADFRAIYKNAGA